MRQKQHNGVAVRVGGLQNFSSEADRTRLTPAALAGAENLAKHWKLTRDESAGLLALSPTTWDRIVSHARSKALSQDQMTRISALIGIFKGLHLLFSDGMADRWLRLRNAGPLFDERTPLEVMLEGGIPVMLEVRRHVDALRGGL